MEKETKRGYNPTAALLFLFATNCFVFWARFKGYFTGNTLLVASIISLVGLPIYLMGAKALGESGDNFNANLYFIFGALFCGEFGFNNLFTYFGAIYGWAFDSSILSIPLFISGIIVIPVMVPYRFAPWVPFVTWTIACIWLFVCGFLYLYPTSYLLFDINNWLAVITATGVTYLGVVEMFASCGVKIPLGKPLFKYKSGENA